MALGKKLLILLGAAGAGLYYANEQGLLSDLLPEDPYDEIEDDDEDPYNEDEQERDLNINNPLALLAISMATQAGLRGAAKAVKKAVAPKAPNPTKVTPTAPKAVGVKPATPAVNKAAALAGPKASAAAVADAAPVKASGPKPATAATNAAAAAPAPKAPVGPAAKSAAKAGKASTMMAKLKGTPADLIVMVIAQVLSAVLDLDPDSFKACEGGEFDMGKLPDWANALIGAIPFLGDLFDLIGNKLCLRGGCPKDTEESAGLCYKACEPGFKSDGAIMCYKQYPEFENNGMGHTITSITKKILLDTGKIPERCNEDEDKVGALCYEKVDGFTNVAGTVWQNCPAGHTDTGIRCEKLHTLPAGTLPRLSDCPAGWTNDGLTCRAPITMSSCNGGDVDDGLLCRAPLRGGNCNTWWDGCCWRGAFGECWGCARTHCEPITGGNVYHKTLYGGQVEGRTLRGPDADEDRIDGLDYKKCPEGMVHQPGMPYLCSASFTKQSRVLAPRLLKCNRTRKDGVTAGQVEWDEETNIAGLCYGKIPPGYSRKLIGTLDQDCPGGSTDFGVGCTRQAYNRGAGLIPLGIRVKDRI